MTIVVKADHAKMRLDKFLAEHFPDFSRAHLQKLIKSGQVTVNGQKVAPHHFLREDDEVEAMLKAPEELKIAANSAVQFELLHEDPHFLIINKPAGLVIHQGAGHKAPDTLANGLLARYPEIAKIGEDPLRPGIMHRLDADVSGVMVVARTQDMFDHLKRQFKLHQVEKEYVAVVAGKVSPPEGVIEFAVARKGARMVARPKGAQGKRAVTEYEVIAAGRHPELVEGSHTLPKARDEISRFAQNDKFSTLKIRTRTGRTHQIRVHLQALGNPIVGDVLYRGARSQKLEARRLMLHARKVGFKDLEDKRREFICEPPEEFSF